MASCAEAPDDMIPPSEEAADEGMEVRGDEVAEGWQKPIKRKRKTRQDDEEEAMAVEGPAKRPSFPPAASTGSGKVSL